MPVQDVAILPAESGKGRTFRASRITALTADALWDGGSKKKYDRPVYATFVGSENELRPFVANLLTGRPAVPDGRNNDGSSHDCEGYEFLKSAGYRSFLQRTPDGAVATIYLPHLLVREPGMVDPDGVTFVLALGRDYLAQQAERLDVEGAVAYARALPLVREANAPETDWRGHVVSGWEEPLSRAVLADMVPLAYACALWLGSRTRAPIPPDGKFYLQMLLALLNRRIAAFPSSSSDSYGRRAEFGKNAQYGFRGFGLDEAGGVASLAVKAPHSAIEEVLAAECGVYFETTEGN